jgi:hypothetical protein
VPQVDWRGGAGKRVDRGELCGGVPRTGGAAAGAEPPAESGSIPPSDGLPCAAGRELHGLEELPVAACGETADQLQRRNGEHPRIIYGAPIGQLDSKRGKTKERPTAFALLPLAFAASAAALAALQATA